MMISTRWYTEGRTSCLSSSSRSRSWRTQLSLPVVIIIIIATSSASTTTTTQAAAFIMKTASTTTVRTNRSSSANSCNNIRGAAQPLTTTSTTVLKLSVLDPTTDVQHHQQHVKSLLMESVYYQPAAEHTQPFWGGTLDPYLSAGKSIVPSTKALSDMSLTTINDKSNAIAAFGEKITEDNKFIIDATQIQLQDLLPGFTPTGGILSHSSMAMDTGTAMSTQQQLPPSVVSFVASIDWASKFINVIDQLPIAVLVYVLIEFFILRPNINTYKEDIEDDPTGMLADTIAVATVRVSMFCIVAIATVGIFG